MALRLFVTAILIVCVISKNLKGLLQYTFYLILHILIKQLFLSICVGSHSSKHEITYRQNIAADNGQMVQVNDLIQQLQKQQFKLQSGNLIDQSSNNAESLNGLVGAGVGLQYGSMNNRVDKSALMGSNGISKSALNDIIFGDLKGLDVTGPGNIASYIKQPENSQGGEIRQMLAGPVMNSNRMDGNGMMPNLAALAAANNLAGTQGLNGFNINPNNGLSMTEGTMSSFGLNGVSPNLIGPPGMGPGNPMQGPNPAIGMQLMSQLSNMNSNGFDDEDLPIQVRHHHYKRHHRHHKHRKSTTKLLLRLLMDKMKDIYELDKATKLHKNIKVTSLLKSKDGRIGLNLDDLGVPKTNVHTKETKTKLKSDDANAQKTSDDDQISNILSSIHIKDLGSGYAETLQKNEDLTIKELDDPLSKDIVSAKEIEGVPSETSAPVIGGKVMEDGKATIRDTIGKVNYGDRSEFHTVRLDGEEPSKGTKKIASDFTEDGKSFLSESPKVGGFNGFGYDNAKVTAPEILSVSSILNLRKNPKFIDPLEDDKIVAQAKMSKSYFDFVPNKRKISPDLKILPEIPSDFNKEEDTLQTLTDAITHEVTSKAEDGAKYVKSAQVLGVVFKKVKDPLAKKSIETAIKAMLEVMKYKNSEKSKNLSKKHNFPADANAVLMQQIQKLNSVLHEMKKRIQHKRSEFKGF